MAKSKPAEKPVTPEAEKPAPAPTPAPAETVSPKIETVTAAELNAVVEMPLPNERTISAMAEDANPAASSGPSPTGTPTPTPSLSPKPGDLDKSGKAFDPDRHNPRLNRDGEWAGKQGRPKGSPTTAKPAAPTKPASVVGTSDTTGTGAGGPIGDRFDLAAELYTRAGYSVLDGVFAGGGEWLPESDGEHVALRGSVASYLRHKGSEDLPPGLAVALALATYGAKRISKPNTATRLRLYVAWIKARWGAWRTGRKIDALPEAEIRSGDRTTLPPQGSPVPLAP